MARRRRRLRLRPSSLPDDDDLLYEILLRLPPLPSSLPHASLVCQRWRRLVTDPGFLRGFRAHHHHMPPPLLGFFHPSIRSFSPALDPPDRIPATRFSLPRQAADDYACTLLGCRHGIALLLDRSRREAVLWNPVTGGQHRVPVPQEIVLTAGLILHGALVPAASNGHDLCLAPFKLVFLCSRFLNPSPLRAYLYQSESGVWSDVIRAAISVPPIPPYRQGVLAGNALYWVLHGGDILMFDLDAKNLTVIKKPLCMDGWYSYQILRTKDHGPGLAVSYGGTSLQLWELCERKADSSRGFTWMKKKTVEVSKLLPLESCLENVSPYQRFWGMMRMTMALFFGVLLVSSTFNSTHCSSRKFLQALTLHHVIPTEVSLQQELDQLLW